MIWTPDQSIPQMKAANDSYQAAIDKVDSINSQISEIGKQAGNVKPEIKEKALIMLSDSIDIIKLYNEVINIGSKAGVSVEGLKISPPSQGLNNRLTSYKVSFSMKASYPVFKKFLELIESNMRFFTVDQITIKTENKKSEEIAKDEDLLDFSLVFKVYSLK